MNVAILLAGGVGRRMNTKLSKQFLKINKEPVISYALKAFDQHADIDEIVVVTRPEDIEILEELVISKMNLKKKISLVDGGQERYDSVKNGIEALGSKVEIVLIHDGVRPFVNASIIDRNIACAKEAGACVTAVKSKDTVKLATSSGDIEVTPPRSTVYLAQTPQSFKLEVIKDAINKNTLASGDITDDSMVVERAGYRVKLVEGSYKNIKITTPEDLMLASQILGEEE